MGDEEWRPVVGYEGQYSVSSFGRVRSEDRVALRKDGVLRRAKGKVLSLAMPSDSTSYVKVNLWRDNRGCSRNVHVLVAEAFIGVRPHRADVCHRDGKHENNRSDNLYYGSRSENMYDCISHGTHSPTNQQTCKYGHELGGDNSARRSNLRHRGNCRACANARSSISSGYNKGQDFLTLADSYYYKHTGMRPERKDLMNV